MTGGRIIGCLPFRKVLILCEMQTISFRFWIRVSLFIFNGNNDHIAVNPPYTRKICRHFRPLFETGWYFNSFEYNVAFGGYTLPSWRLSTLAKELTTANWIRRSSSNELSTPVSDSVKWKQTKANGKCVNFLCWRRSPNWLSGKILSLP